MSAIFEDLEIDYEIMMTEPETFWFQVTSAAERLKKVLKADINVDNYIKNQIAAETFDFGDYDRHILNLISEADELVPVGALKELANKFRKLARDLEFLARDKAMLELATDETLDKGLAIELYKDLKKKTDMVVEGWKVLNIYHGAEKLPSLPGNYGTNLALTRYVFVFTGDNTDGIPYREASSVIRRLNKLGHNLEAMNLMDLVDYLRAHPELGVTVSEQRK